MKPETRDYPPPRLPVHPVVTRDSFRGPLRAPVPSIREVSTALRFVSGRFGLARALELCEVGSSDEVLVPAYSCPAMVSPIHWLEATAIFYKSREDLCPDLEDIEAKISPRTKCVLVVHYFGFVQDLKPLRELCDRRGFKLIEDCAHAYFGTHEGQPIGSCGDFAFASPMKFFPIYDGGCLVSTRSFESPQSRRGSLRYELKVLVNTLDRSHEFGRPPAEPLASMAMAARRRAGSIVRSRQAASSSGPAPAALSGGYGFEGSWAGIDMSRTSRWIMSRVSQERLVRSRRANYRWLGEFFQSFRGARPLKPDLSDTTVPYVFPVYLDDPDRVFPKLKNAGVPLLRWDDADIASCPLSATYSKHLLMVPCHQELDTSDLEWIAARFEEALVSTNIPVPEEAIGM